MTSIRTCGIARRSLPRQLQNKGKTCGW